MLINIKSNDIKTILMMKLRNLIKLVSINSSIAIKQLLVCLLLIRSKKKLKIVWLEFYVSQVLDCFVQQCF